MRTSFHYQLPAAIGWLLMMCSVVLEVDGWPFLVSREGHVPFSGDKLGVRLAPEDLHWFDARSGLRLINRLESR